MDVEELVDTDDSDATLDDNDDDSVAQPFTSEPTVNEPVIAVADGKIACETCGKRFKPRGMNTDKATQKIKQSFLT